MTGFTYCSENWADHIKAGLGFSIWKIFPGFIIFFHYMKPILKPMQHFSCFAVSRDEKVQYPILYIYG